MSTKPGHKYVPDYAVIPGETLLEHLDAVGISQAELAERTARPKKTINEIIKGKAAITPETALQLERVLGVSATFWNNLEQGYRTALARAEERERLSTHMAWLDRFPVKALVERAWIQPQRDQVQLFEAVLSFFGVASPEAWDNVWSNIQNAVAFRESPAFQSDFPAVATWLRKGELEARVIQCEPYNAERFRSALTTIRSFTTVDPNVFFKDVRQACAAAGVAVVLVPELPKLRLCGATRWLAPETALIQLSLRYKMHDQLWFTFFHEAGHILLHGKRSLFVEGAKNSSASVDSSQQEREADKFAQDFLIPPDAYVAFVERGVGTCGAIQQFARNIGIAPGIVLGRLQHDGHVPFNACMSLKQGLKWSDEN
jgi:HTH-type transcriptional regulator / antitoxin HigA